MAQLPTRQRAQRQHIIRDFRNYSRRRTHAFHQDLPTFRFHSSDPGQHGRALGRSELFHDLHAGPHRLAGLCGATLQSECGSVNEIWIVSDTHFGH